MKLSLFVCKKIIWTLMVSDFTQEERKIVAVVGKKAPVNRTGNATSRTGI